MTTTWLVLTATLPANPSGLRVRVWRALKATGAGTLRDGVYVLPDHAGTAQALWELERTIVEAGAPAHLLVLQARDAAQEESFRSLFDRSQAYAEFLQAIKDVQARVGIASEAELRKDRRSLETRLLAIQTSDFFPGKDGRKAVAALAALRREIDLHVAPDEPASTDARIPSRAIADYQGRVWATRRRPRVDRLATAWLVRRHIDQSATFTWLGDAKKCPDSVLGYDFDGATFTHVGDKVTFEVVAESFGLLGDAALRKFAKLVHFIDVGGIPVDEAPGLEMLVRGLQSRHEDDDQLLAAALPVFDACYEALKASHDS